MVVHAKMPNYNFQSIKEANQAFITRTINQRFFNRENSFNFVLGLLSLKNFIIVGFKGVKSFLS